MTETTIAPSIDERYPEHAKLSKISAMSQTIGEFLEFAGSQGIGFGRTVTDRVAVFEGTEDVTSVRQVGGSELQSLLAEFFAIDLNVIEDEKRQMLADMRAMNAPKGQ
ncbi:hypothetical protein ABZS76_32900 [Streptomyces sp. NPDC005562]|uniref:hypothetical protein n=1 Tax=Streptomyces sp. NPDC005562 TaxID=3154890 RepID=UPI0033A3C456